MKLSFLRGLYGWLGVSRDTSWREAVCTDLHRCPLLPSLWGLERPPNSLVPDWHCDQPSNSLLTVWLGLFTLTISIVNSWFQGPSKVFVVNINLILVVLFQTIFHHIFLCGVSDIAHHVSTSGYYSLEFETKGTYSYLSIRFWKKDTLCVVKLFRYWTASEPAAGVLMAISRLLSVLSAQPQIVSVSGCPAERIPVLEHSGYFERGIEYPFRFDALSLPDKMHEKWGSVFGAISFFSQLKFLITFLDGCAGQPWASLMPEFVKVVICSFARRSNFHNLSSKLHFYVGNFLKQTGGDRGTHDLLWVVDQLEVGPPVSQQNCSTPDVPGSKEQAAKFGVGNHQWWLLSHKAGALWPNCSWLLVPEFSCFVSFIDRIIGSLSLGFVHIVL